MTPKQFKPQFAASFLLCFLLSLPLFWGVVEVQYSPLAKQYLDHSIQWDASLEKTLNTQWINKSYQSPNHSKRMGLFWATRNANDYRGVSIDLKRNPDLFQTAFPGYDIQAFTPSFWRQYFSLPFGQANWSNPLSGKDSIGTAITLASHGCFLLTKHYGSDILVFGNSEAGESLVLSELSKGINNAKTTSCVTPGVPFDHFASFVSIFKRTPRKAKLAILGVPNDHRLFQASILHSPNQLIEINRTHQKLREDIFSHNWLRTKLSDFFHQYLWDDFFSPNIQDTIQIIKTKNDGWKKEKYMDFGMTTHSHGLILKDLSKMHEPIRKYLTAKTKKTLPTDCPLEPFSQQLDQTLLSLKQVSDQVVLYTPPINPLALTAHSKERWECVEKMLLTKASERVQVITGDWKSYGLSYKDYVRHYSTEKHHRLNFNHLNISGARKVTRHLLRQIKSHDLL